MAAEDPKAANQALESRFAANFTFVPEHEPHDRKGPFRIRCINAWDVHGGTVIPTVRLRASPIPTYSSCRLTNPTDSISLGVKQFGRVSPWHLPFFTSLLSLAFLSQGPSARNPLRRILISSSRKCALCWCRTAINAMDLTRKSPKAIYD